MNNKIKIKNKVLKFVFFLNYKLKVTIFKKNVLLKWMAKV